jgi:hypothetical protein
MTVEDLLDELKGIDPRCEIVVQTSTNARCYFPTGYLGTRNLHQFEDPKAGNGECVVLLIGNAKAFDLPARTVMP